MPSITLEMPAWTRAARARSNPGLPSPNRWDGSCRSAGRAAGGPEEASARQQVPTASIADGEELVLDCALRPHEADFVALVLAQDGLAERRVDRQASGRRVCLLGSNQAELDLLLLLLKDDGRTQAGYARGAKPLHFV